MQIVILCGGIGARLKEETEFRPKPMIHIGNWPILWHIMKIYSFYGHKEFVLSLGYRGDMIKEYFCHFGLLNNDVTVKLGQSNHIELHSSQSDENEWQVTLADTGEKALKGARLKRIGKYIYDKTFMMTYGDGVADIDLNKLLEFHRAHKKMATVTGINIYSRFGEMKIKNDQVKVFNEKPKVGTEFINGGYFVFNREVFDYFTDDDECDLEVGPLERIAQDGQLMAYRHLGSWACMDTQRDKDYLNKLWDENKAFWKVW